MGNEPSSNRTGRMRMSIQHCRLRALRVRLLIPMGLYPRVTGPRATQIRAGVFCMRACRGLAWPVVPGRRRVAYVAGALELGLWRRPAAKCPVRLLMVLRIIMASMHPPRPGLPARLESAHRPPRWSMRDQTRVVQQALWLVCVYAQNYHGGVALARCACNSNKKPSAHLRGS